MNRAEQHLLSLQRPLATEAVMNILIKFRVIPRPMIEPNQISSSDSLCAISYLQSRGIVSPKAQQRIVIKISKIMPEFLRSDDTLVISRFKISPCVVGPKLCRSVLYSGREDILSS